MFFGTDIPTIIALIITLLVAFTIHELAHAWTALQLGDTTARDMGRVTLNPLAHLDPMGTILLIIAGFGWAKPVPVNPNNLRGNPRHSMAIVALAGPISNIIMASAAAIPFKLGLLSRFSSGTAGNVAQIFYIFILINMILAFFNMIPLHPLDGSKVLEGVLPAEMAYQYRTLVLPYAQIILLALIFLPRFIPLMPDILGTLVFSPAQQVTQLLIG